MEQFEKVEKGLERCSKYTGEECETCPYDKVCFPLPGARNPLMMDTLALIRAQQEHIKELEAGQTARVMTLEEVEDALDTVVWVDRPGIDNTAEEYALIMAYSHKYGFALFNYAFGDSPSQVRYEYPEYGKDWRCWTQRPTDEQREAVKWE